MNKKLNKQTCWLTVSVVWRSSARWGPAGGAGGTILAARSFQTGSTTYASRPGVSYQSLYSAPIPYLSLSTNNTNISSKILLIPLYS